jgi:hypothetical protein
MASNKKIAVGRQVTIPAGTRVTRNGVTTKRVQDSVVTVRAVEFTRNGNPKIYWKSHGLSASAVLK